LTVGDAYRWSYGITRCCHAGTRSDDPGARAENWERAAREVSESLRRDETCAFATIGDPNVYSTFTYLARTIKEYIPEVEIHTIPGITAMQDLASKSGTVNAVSP
jgi:precorrin-2/cobalt-factor-2 C20-methyltransferase